MALLAAFILGVEFNLPLPVLATCGIGSTQVESLGVGGWISRFGRLLSPTP